MLRRLLGLCFLATLLLAAGCDSDGASEASVTPSGSATATSTVFVLDHSTPSLPPTATPGVEMQHTVWLINLWEDEQYTIYEHADVPPGDVGFVRSRQAGVTRPSGRTTYGANGQPRYTPGLRCTPAPSGVEIGSLRLDEIPACGPTSPYGRYMLYRVPSSPTELRDGQVVDTWDEWVFDIERAHLDGEGAHRLLAEGLVSCGGCDGKFGPQWSPDGRYVTFAETVQGGRVFLADLERGTSEVIGMGTGVESRPSLSDDSRPLLLVRGEDESAVLVDAATGERTTLPIGWPARFDATGTLAYSPSSALRRGEAPITSVVDIATLEVTEVAGLAPWRHLWWDNVAVAARYHGDGFTAALEQEDCAGTVVHSTGVASRCVEGAYGGTPSWDGQQVAFAMRLPWEDVRRNGTRFVRYDIAVLDVATGDIGVVAEGAYSTDDLPPRIQWSRFGDLLLVSWPQALGA